MEPKWMARQKEGAWFGRAQLYPSLSIVVPIPLQGSKKFDSKYYLLCMLLLSMFRMHEFFKSMFSIICRCN